MTQPTQTIPPHQNIYWFHYILPVWAHLFPTINVSFYSNLLDLHNDVQGT